MHCAIHTRISVRPSILQQTVNEFRFDETLLSDGTISFRSFDAYTEDWADFVYQHRDETKVPPYMHDYDVVYGPIANDRVGLQIRNYRLGNISKKEFLRRLKYMKGITSDLIQLLMDREHYTLPQAVETVYGSSIYQALQRPSSGLYAQSSGYVYEYLLKELKTKA